MKALMLHGERDVRLVEVDVPQVGPKDALVRVRASGICGSDVHRYLATDYGRITGYPVNSGHEYCGDVAEIGNEVTRFAVGDRATLGAAWFGTGYLGAFAEYVLIPDADARLTKVPRTVGYRDGAVLEPFTVALKSCVRPTITPDDTILIQGAGPIGLAILLLLRARGIEDVIVSEPSTVRRELAAKIGCTAIDPTQESLPDLVAERTGGRGVDMAFDCAGLQVTLDAAFSLTRRDGRVGLIAHYRDNPRFDIETIVRNQRSIYPMGADDVTDEAIRLVAESTVDLAQLITHEFPLEQAHEAFEVACDARESVKVVFIP